MKADALEEVKMIPPARNAQQRLERSRLQQARLAEMALKAAESFWPGFKAVADAAVEEEYVALNEMGALA